MSNVHLMTDSADELVDHHLELRRLLDAMTKGRSEADDTWTALRRFHAYFQAMIAYEEKASVKNENGRQGICFWPRPEFARLMKVDEWKDGKIRMFLGVICLMIG